MANVKKMASGGALSDIVGAANSVPSGDASSAPSAAPALNSNATAGAANNLSNISQSADQVQKAISTAANALNGSGTASSFKKGGHITTRRVSSVTRSTKSPTW